MPRKKSKIQKQKNKHKKKRVYNEVVDPSAQIESLEKIRALFRPKLKEDTETHKFLIKIDEEKKGVIKEKEINK